MARSILILVVLTLAMHAQAEQLIYVLEQERTVQGTVDNGVATETQTATAANSLPWTATVTATLVEPDEYELTASGAQYSELTDDTLTAYGLATTSAKGYVNAWTAGESIYHVRFAIAQSVTYHLTGSLAAYADADGNCCCNWQVYASATVSLDQIAGPDVFFEEAQVALLGDVEPVSDAGTLDLVGILSPGVYELDIRSIVDTPYLDLDFPTYEPPIYGGNNVHRRPCVRTGSS